MLSRCTENITVLACYMLYVMLNLAFPISAFQNPCLSNLRQNGELCQDRGLDYRCICGHDYVFLNFSGNTQGGCRVHSEISNLI